MAQRRRTLPDRLSYHQVRRTSIAMAWQWFSGQHINQGWRAKAVRWLLAYLTFSHESREVRRTMTKDEFTLNIPRRTSAGSIACVVVGDPRWSCLFASSLRTTEYGLRLWGCQLVVASCASQRPTPHPPSANRLAVSGSCGAVGACRRCSPSRFQVPSAAESGPTDHTCSSSSQQASLTTHWLRDVER